MKKIVVTIVALSLLLAVLPIKAQASRSVPTVKWNLHWPDALSAAEAKARHCGHYDYSAYVNKFKLYSNYYFKADAPNHYRFYGKEVYALNRRYQVAMVNKKWGTQKSFIIYENTHEFDYWMSYYTSTLSDEAYFYINGAPYGTEISVNGFVDTY